MRGKYANYAELAHAETLGRDYRIHSRLRESCFAIIAPHGGAIERGTLRVADTIAGSDYSWYAFEGLRLQRSRELHISSARFDEPTALKIARSSKTVVTIHGAKGEDEVAYFGGLDMELREQVRNALNAAGFQAEDDPSPTRQGKAGSNICNRGQSSKGVQIELTTGLRKSLFNHIAEPDMWEPNKRLERFAEVVRNVLNDHRTIVEPREA